MNIDVKTDKKIAGYVYLLIGVFFLASNFIVGNYGESIPPWQLAFLRFLIAFIIIVPFIILRIKNSLPILIAHWYLLLIYGILGIAIASGFAYISLRETTAINGAFIFASSPIITLIVARILLKEKLNIIQWLGVVVVLLGVLIIICHGQIKLLLQLKFGAGDLWMLANAISWAFYTVLIKRWKIPVDHFALFAGMIFMGLIVMAPFCIYELFNHQQIIFNLKNIFTILYAGIFAGALGYFLYLKGVKLAGPSKASLFIYLMPVFATIQAYFFLNEKLYLYDLIAIIMIFFGIIVSIFMTTAKSS